MYMKRHIQDVHKEKQEYLCPQCGKLSTKISGLKAHIKDTQGSKVCLPYLLERSGQ